jgi:hypothetical protein
VPVLVADCQRHPKIEAIQHVDFSSPTSQPWEILEERIREVLPLIRAPDRVWGWRLLYPRRMVSGEREFARVLGVFGQFQSPLDAIQPCVDFGYLALDAVQADVRRLVPDFDGRDPRLYVAQHLQGSIELRIHASEVSED